MAAAKRLIICCDGTWNEPDERPTNVTKLVRSIRPQDSEGVHQVVYYDQGIGTGDAIDKYVGGVFGYGMEQNVLDAYRFLVHNYQAEDELYFFGFSRGAFTARALVGFVHSVGLIEKHGLEQLKAAYQYYRTAPEKRPPSQYDDNYRPDIHMVGVFDTVGALGAPTRLLGKATRPWVGFYNTHISPLVKHAYHALALDERRGPFKPDLWTGSLNNDQYMEQCWFAGAHSDIGGGYDNEGLSDIALQWMLLKACALGLEFNHSYLATIIKPDLDMQPHDSYSVSYKMLGLLSAGKPIRHIYGDASNPPINISIHDSVYQRIAKGKYLPQNPDFPPADTLKNRRQQLRDMYTDTPLIELVLTEQAISCRILDYSQSTGVRIQYNGELKEGDSLSIDSERFGNGSARCVWKKSNQYGLRFDA